MTRPLSCPPTALEAPHSLGGKTRPSGIYETDGTTASLTCATTVTHDVGVTYGSMVPFGPPNAVKSLRGALTRMNGFASWSCGRSSTGKQLAVACIGPLTVSAEAESSELAIERLRDLVVGLESARKELCRAV